MVRLSLSFLFVFALVGCEAAEDSSGNPSSIASVIGQALVEDCPNGGVVVGYGIDDNANGVLDADEVDGTETICHGEDGEDGQDGAPGPQGEAGVDGADGEPCTATDNGDGTYTIECPEGTSVTVADGADGQDGEDGAQGPQGAAGADGAQGPQGEAGADGQNGADGEDGQDGAQGPQGAAGVDGADGEPCTATDNGDGTYTIDCPDGTSVTVADGADGYSALVSVDSEVGDNCFGGSTGTRIQTGTDNGDGGGVAGDGILQAGEVDSTVYLCIDCAGDLNGTDSSCVDCAGVFNGGAVEDACGVCGGDGSSCGPPEGFVLIETGTFTMGSPESELGRGSNETQHQVTLTNDFYMSDHEVTQAEWQALIGNNPSGKNNGTCETCPVETVNWWEALHYANALSESEGLTACYVLEGCNGDAVGADKECTGVTLQDGSGNPVTTP